MQPCGRRCYYYRYDANGVRYRVSSRRCYTCGAGYYDRDLDCTDWQYDDCGDCYDYDEYDECYDDDCYDCEDDCYDAYSYPLENHEAAPPNQKLKKEIKSSRRRTRSQEETPNFFDLLWMFTSAFF